MMERSRCVSQRRGVGTPAKWCRAAQGFDSGSISGSIGVGKFELLLSFAGENGFLSPNWVETGASCTRDCRERRPPKRDL